MFAQLFIRQNIPFLQSRLYATAARATRSNATKGKPTPLTTAAKSKPTPLDKTPAAKTTATSASKPATKKATTESTASKELPKKTRTVSKLASPIVSQRKEPAWDPDNPQWHEGDFRPPWLYTWVKIGRFTVIPAVVIYGVFFYDFGQYEHAFQPPRRWMLRHKSEFFELSPAELKLLNEPFPKFKRQQYPPVPEGSSTPPPP